MRVKYLVDAVPISSIRTVWERITFSRLTLAYFLFTLLHFVLQLAFQAKAFTINVAAANFLSSIVAQGDSLNNSVPFLDGDQLRLCSWVPSNLNTDVDSCRVVWDGSKGSNTLQGGLSQASSNTSVAFDVSQSYSGSSVGPAALATPSTTSIAGSIAKARPTQTVTVFIQPTPTHTNSATIKRVDEEQEDDNNEDELDKRGASSNSFTPVFSTFVENGQVNVNITGLGYKNVPATLDSKCLWSLSYPTNILYNTKREDIVFILFQFWVLGMSVVALLNESIPHIIAALVTHILATAWGAFQIHNTAIFRANFNRVITQGACSGVPFLTNYWQARAKAEIPSVALNAFALVISAWLTWRLMKLFGWQTFKRVGASIKINRIYKLVLTLSIFIQLTLFFIVVTVSLWLDQLLNSGIGDMVDFLKLYKASSIATLALSLPWFISGWSGVRRELRAPMFVFLFLSILYLGGWSVMFFSVTFRWTFVTWRFFSVMASSSVFLTTSCFILGVICRFNFGKGLIRYLNAQEPLPGDDFVPYTGTGSDVEKVAFPSNEKPIPTFSAAFGSGDEVPPPSQMFSSTTRMGPRFFNQVASPFDKRASYSSQESGHLTPPPAALSRTPSIESNYSNVTVTRMDSQRSEQSIPSYYTYNRSEGTSPVHQQPKRWVIE